MQLNLDLITCLESGQLARVPTLFVHLFSQPVLKTPSLANSPSLHLHLLFQTFCNTGAVYGFSKLVLPDGIGMPSVRGLPNRLCARVEAGVEAEHVSGVFLYCNKP